MAATTLGDTSFPKQTFYDILEVPPTASLETIKVSYQTKVRKLHPDKVSPDCENNEVAFLTLQSAWECLRDSVTRKEYDTEIARGKSQKSKSQEVNAVDWELIEEEDTGEKCYVYACRCGEEMWLPESTFQTADGNHAKSVVYVTCTGCSLVYHVIR
jgi:Pyruvate/2-oxoacid:ferredoxin oxidoreductase delta subunit